MSKFSVKNLTKSTPSKWVRIGLVFTAVSTAISGYGLTADDKIVSYIGLGCLVVGTVISNGFGELKKEG